jgi:hypothetical protein
MPDSFTADLSVGDMVLWYSNPYSAEDPAMGWISKKPGNQTITLLVYAEDAGFVEKPSVRHKDDPFWKENDTAAAWGRWGAFTLHPSTIALKEVQGLITKLKLQAASIKKKEDKE